MKNLVLLFILGFFAFSNAFAQVKQTIGADNLKVGNSANAYNPTIEFNGTNVKVRANKTSGVAEFTNDGSLWKKMGSGSGSGDGGISILENGSFEDGLTPGWTSSGGTFSQQSYTNSVEGELKFARFIATTSGQYFETSLKAIPDFSNGGCLAKINYNTTDAANWKLQVYDSSANLLKEETLYSKSWQDGFTSFPCPVAGTQIKLRVISIAAGQIEADKAYLGKENRTFQTQQAFLFGSMKHDTDCAWAVANISAYGDFPVDSTCTQVATGRVGSPSTNLPAFSLPAGSPKGNYKVSISGAFATIHGSASVVECSWKLTDGTNNYPLGVDRNQSNNSTNLQSTSQAFVTNVKLSSDLLSTTTYKIQAYTSTGANANSSCRINSGNSATTETNFFVEYFPDESQTALRPESQDWFIDVNIGGSTPSLGTSSVSSYTEIADASLDMVPNDGSASARIPCSSTNASSGPTCSAGSESVGVNFINPTPGRYEVCASFGYEGAVSGISSTVVTNFQLVQTSNGSQTIIQEGKTRIGQRTYSSTANAVAQGVPVNFCGIFNFADAGEKTIRLMHEQFVNGTVTASTIHADRGASYGQRDIRIIVRPLLSPYNRPYLVGEQVTSSGGSSVDVQTVYFGTGANCSSACTTGFCSICMQTGTKIISVEYNGGGGAYKLNGLDGTKYHCNGSGSGAAQASITSIRNTGTSSYTVIQATNNTTGTNVGNASVHCYGNK